MHARKRGVEIFEKLSRERKSMSMEKKRKKEKIYM
jgi:hypothetical protein